MTATRLADRTCSVNDCQDDHHARGFCCSHYARWRRHGDPHEGGPHRIVGDDDARFDSYVETDGPVPEERPDLGPCHLWTGALSHGYGYIRIGDRPMPAHRYAWEREHGPVPDGLELDHLCRTPACVRPSHLEPVTHRVNSLRGESPPARNARMTHCHRGHPFDEENTYWRPDGRGRHCLACERNGRRQR